MAVFNMLSQKDWNHVMKSVPIPCIDLAMRFNGMFEDSFLFIQRSIEPYKGLYAFPGGRILKGEDIEEARLRIARREVGIDIEPYEATLINAYSIDFDWRHDITLLYYIDVPNKIDIELDMTQSSGYRFSRTLPKPTGELYEREWRDLNDSRPHK